MSQPNPYTPGPTKPHPNSTADLRVDHGRAYKYIFENPNWFMNVLYIAIGTIVPIVGPIVVQGYQFEVVEYLHRSRGTRYPDFTFDRLSEYLLRGLWVFLVSMVASIVLVPVFWVALIAFGLVTGSLVAAGGEAMVFVTIPGLVLSIMALSILVSMVLVPMVLKAGLQQDFGAAFDFNFVSEFVSNNFKQFFITGIVMFFVAILAMVAGFAAACVGIYFAMAIVNLMYAHVLWQFYELHLAKGGQPIPLKQEYPPAGFPHGQPPQAHPPQGYPQQYPPQAQPPRK